MAKVQHQFPKAKMDIKPKNLSKEMYLRVSVNTGGGTHQTFSVRTFTSTAMLESFWARSGTVICLERPQ